MKKTVTLFLLILALASCKPKENMVYMSTNHQSEQVNLAKFNSSRIQEGDVLLIQVAALDEIAARPFNLNSMSRSNTDGGSNQEARPSEYLVNADGSIHFPVIGRVQVLGLTKEQLKGVIEKRIQPYLSDPLVSVHLKNFNISVLGEVRAPGQKQSYTEKVNIFQALALGGDMTEYGDRTRVKLIRSQQDGADLVVNLDLSDAYIIQSPYYYLQQNDVLYVEPDVNKQVAANTSPNRALLFQVIGTTISVVTLILAITR